MRAWFAFVGFVGILVLMGSCGDVGGPVDPGQPTKLLRLTYPRGGETFFVGRPVKIQWEADSIIAGVGLVFSVDGGTTIDGYLVANGSIETADSTHTYWTPTAEDTSSSCVIIVYEYGNDNLVNDVSGVFTVAAE